MNIHTQGTSAPRPSHPAERLAKWLEDIAKWLAKKGALNFHVDESQLGRKLGKHVWDFGLNPSNSLDRQRVVDLIYSIGQHPDKAIPGRFRGQGLNGATGPVEFRIKGNDVVVTTPCGNFVTIMKDGTENIYVQEALRMQ